MSRLHFVKPSPWRVLWSTIGVAVLCGVLAGVTLFAYETTLPSDPPTPTGDYIRLFIWDILLWGPAYLLMVWQITVPVMIALGVLAASLRKAPTG